MAKFKTVGKSDNFIREFDGEMKVLSANGFDVNVTLMLLNSKKNRNGWIYENLREHLDEFKGTPILISYKNMQLGAGHEMDEIINPDGTIKESFMSAEAERIVGYIPENSNVRLETINEVEWVVADAIIFGWYAPELSERLKGTGLLSEEEKKRRSMRVSIETLIDKGRIEADGTEIFTKWRVLGTTILNDKVNEAVAGANIRVLSAIGVDRMREMTKLRVASANEKSAKQNSKGEKKMKVLKIEDVRAKFDGYTVLGVNGLNVALLSDKGRTCSYTFLENEDTVVPERINEIAVNSIFGEGEDSVSVNVEDITCVTLAKLASANQAVTDLTREKGELEARVNALEAEKLERNKADIKSAMERHLEEIKANCKGISVDCSAIMTDECISEYAKLVGKDGKPCGSEMACKDIDTRCMSEIVAQSKVKANSQVKFAWEDDFNGQPTVKTNSSVEKILE